MISLIYNVCVFWNQVYDLHSYTFSGPRLKNTPNQSLRHLKSVLFSSVCFQKRILYKASLTHFPLTEDSFVICFIPDIILHEFLFLFVFDVIFCDVHFIYTNGSGLPVFRNKWLKKGNGVIILFELLTELETQRVNSS